MKFRDFKRNNSNIKLMTASIILSYPSSHHQIPRVLSIPFYGFPMEAKWRPTEPLESASREKHLSQDHHSSIYFMKMGALNILS